MMDKPTISVIVPVFNGEAYIERFITMLNNQTTKDFEVIFIDDGSLDLTQDILKKHCDKECRFKLHCKDNGGPSSARNIGINFAQGEYLTFIDIDDLIMNDTIEIYINKIKQFHYDILRFNYFLSTPTDLRSGMGNSYDLLEYCDDKDYNAKNDVISSIVKGELATFIWVLVIKREFLLSNGILFDDKLKYMEDKVFYLDIFMKSTTFIFLDELTYFYYYDQDFLNKDRDYFTYYVDNVKKVFSTLLDKVSGNLELEQSVKLNAFRQLNSYLYILYTKKEKNIGSLISNLSLFECILPLQKNNYLKKDEKICVFMIKNKLYLGLKVIYFMKKIIVSLKTKGV